VGEIWHEAQRWLRGDQFDAVMNYIFAWQAMSFFGAKTLRPTYKRHDLRLEPLDAPTFARGIEAMHRLYDWEVTQAQLNLLDSHDTARALWIMGDDTSALRLCALFQMTMPGAPCIYYGDEVGLSAGDDPYCREAFPWHAPEHWDMDLLAFYREATALRHRYPVLRTGSFQTVQAADGVYAFRRGLDGQEALVIFNAASDARTLDVPASEMATGTWIQAWPAGGEDVRLGGIGPLEVKVPARDALVLVSGQ
jgi:neopullulanase